MYPNFKRPNMGENFNYRLISKAEVPKWVTYVEVIKPEDIPVYGRG